MRIKTEKRLEAIRLRNTNGLSVGEIARRIGCSKGSVSLWVRGVNLTEIQKIELAQRDKKSYTTGLINRTKHEEIRKKWRLEGRELAKNCDSNFAIGCALYWAEGGKSGGSLDFSNSDSNMMKIFSDFLYKYFDVKKQDVRININAYLDNGLSCDEINRFWLEFLQLPNECLKSFCNRGRYYQSANSNGYKKNLHKYGVCKFRIHNIELLSKLYGAIQGLFNLPDEDWGRN